MSGMSDFKYVEIVYHGVEPKESYLDAVARGVESTLREEGIEGEICVELTDDERIHMYNREFRSVDRPTDVLSFPVSEGDGIICPPDGHLGDMVISLDTASRQAAELAHSLERELMFLAVHGTLHILGYDHIKAEDEKVMLQKQRIIIGKEDKSI